MQWFRNKKKNSTRAIAVTVVLLCVATLASLLPITPDTPEAIAGDPDFIGGITVNSPKPPAVREYNPGEAMLFSADFKWAYCNNEGNGVTYGRITRPVPITEAHSPFSQRKLIGTRLFPQTAANIARGLRNAENRADTVSASGRGGELIDGVPKFLYLQSLRQAFARWRRREGVYVERFTAPMRPGLYHFKYELEIGSAGDSLKKSGRVVFKVRDQAVCPGGQTPIARPEGGTVCPTGLDISCTASATQIQPGQSVTFGATATSEATFTWYDGPDGTGSVIGGPNTGTTSSLVRTFTQVGQFQVSVVARNAAGQYGVCTRGVTVGDVPDDEDDGELSPPDDFGNRINPNDQHITTPDNERLPLNPSAGAATIDFTLDRPLTNTTCGATWAAANVLRCYMVQGGDRSTARIIDSTGTEQLTPGTYRIDCLAARDGQIVSSETRICQRNPTTREI